MLVAGEVNRQRTLLGRHAFPRYQKFEFAENILHALDQFRAVLDQLVTALGVGIVDAPRHGEDLPALFERLPRGDQRAALASCLDDKRTEAQAADNPVAHGKRALVRRGAERELADETAARLDNLLRERVVFRRIHLVEAAAERGPSGAFRGQCAQMRRRVDPARQSGDDRHAGVGELVAQLLRRLQAVMARLTRPDHGHAPRPRLGDFSLYI